jgi:uncharacterized protein (DUF1330 family)
MALTLCVLLTAVPGHEAGLADYEDQVLALLADHGARVLQRVRTIEGPADAPSEVHVLEFPSQDALDEYMKNPARLALADLRDRSIASTQLLRVEVV